MLNEKILKEISEKTGEPQNLVKGNVEMLFNDLMKVYNKLNERAGKTVVTEEQGKAIFAKMESVDQVNKNIMAMKKKYNV